MSPWRRIYPIYQQFSVYGPGPSSKVKAIVLFATAGVGAMGATVLVFLQAWGC